MIKKEMYQCPNCGGYGTEINDLEMDIDCLWTKHYCRECEATWSEYYTLTYDGYVHVDKSYGPDGKEND